MAFELVQVIMPSGEKHGPIDWNTVVAWVRQQRLPRDAVLVDTVTGYQQPVEAFPQLVAARRSDDSVATLIPYRNMPALVGYYLGVFSFLSCVPVLGLLGMPLGVAALVLGILGLKKANANPDAKGRVHAWIAIVCGTLFTLGGIVIHVLFFASMMARR